MRKALVVGLAVFASACLKQPNLPCKSVFNLTGPAAACGEKPLAVYKPEKRQIEILDKIQFEFAKAELRPESQPILNEVAAIIRAHPEVRGVRVEGHASAEGSLDFNMKLSKERAEAVRQYLIQQGIPAAQLESEGYGSYRPLAPNDTEQGRELNRRTEFKVVDGAEAAEPVM